MVIFLVKSAACMLVFFLFYKLLLEQENMHTFKRFYLLAALMVSFIIPSIVFTEYIEVQPTTSSLTTTLSSETLATNPTPIAAQAMNPLDWTLFFWVVYGIGVLGFGIRFFGHLFQIGRRIKGNPKLKSLFITKVLLLEQLPPHTFFKYIFVNKKKFENNDIPEEVMLHEETHARQGHSIDVLFVEFLQIIFWFNPLVHLYKTAIKLNHEFLADSAVLKKNQDRINYQNTLLSYLSPESAEKYQSTGIANAINYSSIKKRFTIMKKQTSKKGVLFRSLLVLPLLAILLYSFTETKMVPKETLTKGTYGIEGLSPKTDNLDENSNIARVSNRVVELAGLVIDSETFQPIKNVGIYDAYGNLLSKSDGRGYYKVEFDKLGTGEIQFEFSLHKEGYKPLAERQHWGNLQGKIKSTFYFGLQKHGSDSPELSDLATNNKDLSYQGVLDRYASIKKGFEFEKQVDIAKKGNLQVFFEFNGSYYLVNDSGWIKLGSKSDLVSIDDEKIVRAYELNDEIERNQVLGMTPLANDNAQFAIYTESSKLPESLQDRASLEEIKKFNTLAKKYNAVPIEKRAIPLKDLNVLETIYRQMSKDQRKEAQPFPECPSPDKVQEIDNLIEININNDGKLLVQSNILELKELKDYLSKINKHLSFEQRKKTVRSVVKVGTNTPKDVIQQVNQILTEYGCAMINIIGPEDSPRSKGQSSATRKEMKEYNTLAKKYNKMDRTNMNIKKKDVERLKYIYGLMSDKQRADTEPFPDFPKPPPPPPPAPVPDTEKVVELPPPPASPRMQEGQKSDVLPPPSPTTVNEIIEVPPPPPHPKSPLDYIIEMAKQDAVFYYQDERISSDRAIQILKENDKINIDSRPNGKNPIVKLSTAPIVIEN